MSENAPAELDGLKKAAVLLVSLGEEASASIMKHLDPEQVTAVAKAVSELGPIESTQAEAVLEEFSRAANAREFQVRGGVEYAKRMLTTAFGADGGHRLMSSIPKPANSGPPGLEDSNPQQLARFVQEEHPQTIALIISRLATVQAAELVKSLPQDLRADVLMRVADLDEVSPDVIRKISTVIGQKLQELGEAPKGQILGGLRTVADLLNRIEPDLTEEILGDIKNQDDALEMGIRNLMLVFEDMLAIDTKALQEIIAKVDRKLLVTGLKGTSEKLRSHFFSCLSNRGAEMLREDMEALGPVRISDVETAQRSILAVVRELESAGVVKLRGSGEEEYVV